MTGLQTYLTDKGWVKTHGNGSYNTYDNCSNSYRLEDKTITIGLMKMSDNSPTMIAILHPVADFLPVSDFGDYLSKYYNNEFNTILLDGKLCISSISTRLEEAIKESQCLQK